MSKSINILHVTDLHLDKALIEDFERIIRKPLKEDVNRRTNESLDLLFITGDIIDKSGANLGGTYEGLKIANEKVIQVISHDLNLSKESIFIIPGNHDINRKADEEIIESGLIIKLKEQKAINTFLNRMKTGDDFGVKRLGDYRKFEREFYADYACEKSDSFYSPTFIKEINNLKIGISCLNSSWRCYSSKNDKGQLLLGDNEIYSSLEHLENCDIKIALIHHHIDFLADFQKTKMENILLKEYDIVFFGHAHDANNYFKVKGANQSIWIGSPAGFCNARTDSRKNASGYSLCTIDEKNTTIQYAYYSNTNKDFRDNTEVGNNGKDVFHALIKEKETDEILKEEGLETTIIDFPELSDVEFDKIPETIFENKLNDFKSPSKLFKGRAKQLSDLRKAFAENEVVTITGIGGIGKTQLIYKFLDDLGKGEREKITWLELTNKTPTPFDNFVLAAGFEVIIQHNKGEREKFSAFLDKIKEFKRILIWDNFHDNKDDTYLRFLEFAKGRMGAAKLIIISRTNDKTKNFNNIELIDFDESIEYVDALLENRYPKLALSFNDEDKYAICKYVKGHPLAIELALELCNSIPTNKVIGKLSRHKQGVDKLSQRLFEEILKQSSPEEKEFLEQFSIFKGRASEQIIEAIFGEDCFFGVLSSLKTKYLIDFDGAKYYDTHPLIREFCYQKLANKKELHATTGRWLIEQRSDKLDVLLEERIFHHLKGAEDYQGINQIIELQGREYATQAFFEPLLEMIDFVQKKIEPTPLHNLLKGDFYKLQSNWDEAFPFYEKVKNNLINAELAIEGLLKCGDLYLDKGGNDKALATYIEAKTIAKEKNNQKYLAWSYNNIAAVQQVLGNYDEAFTLRMKALKISEKLGIQKDIGALYHNISTIYHLKKFKDYNLNKSLEYASNGLKIRLELNDKHGIASSYNTIGYIFNREEYQNYNSSKANDYYNKSLEILIELNNKYGIARSYNNMGVIYNNKEYENYNLTKAKDYFDKSLKIFLELNIKADIAHSYYSLGVIFLKKEYENYNLTKAKDYFDKSLKIRLELNNKFGIADLYIDISYIHWQKDSKYFDVAETLYMLFKSLAIYRQLKALNNIKNTKNIIFSLVRDLGNKTFNKNAQSAHERLEPEYQKEIKLSDFTNIPHKAEKKYGRNDKVKVKYKNGSIKEKKYKQVLKDIKAGKCEIIE